MMELHKIAAMDRPRSNVIADAQDVVLLSREIVQLGASSPKNAPARFLAGSPSPPLRRLHRAGGGGHNSIDPRAMMLQPAPASSSQRTASNDEDEQAAAVSLIFVLHALSGAATALYHSNLLRSPLLPHYRRRVVLQQLELLSFPYVPTTDAQAEIDAYIDRLRTQQPTPQLFLRLLSKPKRFERMTRMSVAEFLVLYHELKPYIARSLPAVQGRGYSMRNRSLHTIEQFLLWVWHSDGANADLLGLLFSDISKTTARRIADHVNTAVLDAWAGEVAWPDAEERRLLYGWFTCYERAVGVLDGTHCQISVPYFKEERSMSGYKKLHTQNYIICADALGFVTYTAGPFEGMANDRTALAATPFVEPDCPLLSAGELILVDGGFAGDGRIVHQFTQHELSKLEGEQRQQAAVWNEDFLYNRTAIEHCIHRIKSRTQALTSRWQRDKAKQSELFLASCRIYNRIRRLRIEHSWRKRNV